MNHIGEYILIMNKNRRGRRIGSQRVWVGTHEITPNLNSLKNHASYNDEESFISKSGIKLIEVEIKNLIYIPTGRRHGGKIYKIQAES